jgi:hypothetical protein
MRRILIKTSFLLAILLISIESFGQQGGQLNPGNKANPVTPGTQTQPAQNQPVQNIQNPADSSVLMNGQTNQNYLPGGSYPVNQNLELNQKNLINQLPADTQKVQINTGIQNNQVTPGIQNQGNPTQAMPSGQGAKNNQINPGMNNNPVVPNDKGAQNPANINKDKPVPGGKKP